MPKLCHARAPADPADAAQIRKLAHSHQAPYDCKQRAQMIALSWEGLRTGEIACHLRCHPQTVRERFERFNAEGLEGLTNRPGAGRKARLTELERESAHCASGPTAPGPARTPGRWTTGCGRPHRAYAMVVGRLGQRRSPAGHRHPAQPGTPHPAGKKACIGARCVPGP